MSATGTRDLGSVTSTISIPNWLATRRYVRLDTVNVSMSEGNP